MRCHLKVSRVLRPGLSEWTGSIARVMTTAAVLACMLGLGARVYSAGANRTLPPVPEDLGPGAELAWWNGAGDGQMTTSVGDVKINIEAYNRKREKEIADKSRKLLSLAIALKTDLDQDPSSEPSPDAMSKANQIEKLAHDVKENMKLSIIGLH
jgi:hypothetical protein